ncbi:MAG: tRNA (adenosine(37)-N6)-dimethylallyltransferase MiaA [Bacteroidales bacterium]|nr:tRNA (adenosine(37)-N6)-dimethylallyltransferase MiaA [Bacteroidales bacterium]
MAGCKKCAAAPLPECESIDIAALRESCHNGGCDLVVILGPTASGKTAYAVSLAKALGDCEIISADSRQVYRRMDIGTGKDLDEYGDIPYHLIDIAEPGDHYNVFEFQKDFRDAYAGITGRGRTAILCGGTGLYINAVTAAYDFRSSKPLSEEGPSNLSRPEGLPGKPFFIGTLVSREERNAKIDARLDARLREGMVEEIKGLLDEGVRAERLIEYGLEYKYVTLYLLGELSYSQMRERLATAIHQFAKRQMTWFRGMQRAGTVIHWTVSQPVRRSDGALPETSSEGNRNPQGPKA